MRALKARNLRVEQSCFLTFSHRFLLSSTGGPGSNILDIAASDDCSSITPESSDGTFNSSVEYVREERMPIGRTMGQLVHLPTGQMVIVNGASKGTAGYTNATYNTVGGVFTEGLAQDPVHQPLLYDPSKKKGSRLSNEGFSSSSIARLVSLIDVFGLLMILTQMADSSFFVFHWT